ncbi:MAG TPA: hypothetical protein VG370_28980 [Chloroflexota bacterium]|nr:hypothetical protein [Chloroflexota bacterium]
MSAAEVRALWEEASRTIGEDAHGAELAVQACLARALALHYRRLEAAMPSPSALPADLAARDGRAASLLRRFLRAPDTRARYVFLGDLLEHVLKDVP